VGLSSQTVAVGHADVQQHDVDFVFQGELDGGGARRDLADHFRFRAGQHRLQPAAHHFVVVGDQQSNLVCH
jgi:hypothetical protein